jgi:pantetheine-phosphate adenylyltransferase
MKGRSSTSSRAASNSARIAGEPAKKDPKSGGRPASGSAKQQGLEHVERVAVFTGSFDPITLGHEDVIRRASQLFDRVVVGVGVANGKNPLFTVEQRVDLLREVCQDLPQVEICSFSGLSVAFAKSKQAKVLVRGIRSTSDYAYEVQMALMNRAMAPEIETIFIPTCPEYSHISSSLAKEIALHGGDTTLLVPAVVANRLSKVMKKSPGT